MAVMEEERSEGQLPRLGSGWPGGPRGERKLQQIQAERWESMKSASHLLASCSCFSKIARHKSQVSLRDHDTMISSSKVSRSCLRLTRGKSVCKGLKLVHWETCQCVSCLRGGKTFPGYWHPGWVPGAHGDSGRACTYPSLFFSRYPFFSLPYSLLPWS